MDILEQIKKLPHSEMAFVFDFDGTITKKYIDGLEVPSAISILRSENILNDEYSRVATVLKNQYHPMEIDPTIPEKERFQKMIEWWEKSIALLIEHKLTLGDIKKATHHPKLVVRGGVLDLVSFAKESNIPFIIFSASGIGKDSISFFLERYNALSSNVHIISNTLEYTNGYVSGVTHPLIHALNKNEEILHSFPKEYGVLLGKKFVLLFGDSPNDIEMVKDANHEKVFRIGLFNEIAQEKKKLHSPLFKDRFDLVIENDGSLEAVFKALTDGDN